MVISLLPKVNQVILRIHISTVCSSYRINIHNMNINRLPELKQKLTHEVDLSNIWLFYPSSVTLRSKQIVKKLNHPEA